MKLRAARPDDIDALAGLAVAGYRHAFSGILEAESLAACDHAHFAARFAREIDKLTLAEDDEGLAGFSLVTGDNLDMLFVAPERLGAGVGTMLLQHAEARGVMTLECFRGNHEARRFYERHGWRLDRAYEREFLGRTRQFTSYAKLKTCA